MLGSDPGLFLLSRKGKLIKGENDVYELSEGDSGLRKSISTYLAKANIYSHTNEGPINLSVE